MVSSSSEEHSGIIVGWNGLPSIVIPVCHFLTAVISFIQTKLFSVESTQSGLTQTGHFDIINHIRPGALRKDNSNELPG